ncbi:hypothetical protein [Mesorhizobium sp. dw_380]|uniref:hypothetical protein n=1 Tax=Mesorhizobium sp. dw_380 TaxID=2812001 RepID=UPI001BDE908C|nr:hypothetical protein [Mesorhizobium sp. dw_380]
MKMVIFCTAFVLVGGGVAVAKDKKVVVSDAAALCSTKHSTKKLIPELDCSLTGTATSPATSGQSSKPRLGYDTNPWLVTGF